MSRREPQVLEKMPDTGRVVIAHPTQRMRAIEIAREQLTDVFLSSFVPVGAAYVMNIDQGANPWPMSDHPVFR